MAVSTQMERPHGSRRRKKQNYFFTFEPSRPMYVYGTHKHFYLHTPTLKVNHAPSETRSLTRSPREETMPGLENDMNHSSSKRLRRQSESVLHVRILGYRRDDESAGEPCKWRRSQCISRPEQQGRHCRMLRFGGKKMELCI